MQETRKELLSRLVDEVEDLGDSVEKSVESSDELRFGLESLRSDISDAAGHFESVSRDTIENLADRLSDFRLEMAETLKEGANTMRKGLIEGHLVGNIVGSLVGGVIQNALQERRTDPRWIMARRIYDAIHIIGDAYNAGDRHDYDATLRLLRVHEFRAEQSRYVVDLLLRAGVLKEYQEEGESTFIMLDPDSEAFEALQNGYRNNTLTYLTAGPSSDGEEDEESV
jgi:hypothetical protein